MNLNANAHFGLLDIGLISILAVGYPLWSFFYEGRQLRQGLKEGTDRKIWWYRLTLATLWPLASMVVVDWLLLKRSFGLLGLTLEADWRVAGGFLLAIAFGIASWLQLRRLRNIDRERARTVLAKRQFMFALLPSGRGQLVYWIAVAITAGVTEELLFRGFAIWAFSAYTNLAVAAVASAVLFGLGHIYQGFAEVLKTAVVGLILAAFYLAIGSLYPVMLLHALLDIWPGMQSYILHVRAAASPDAAPEVKPSR